MRISQDAFRGLPTALLNFLALGNLETTVKAMECRAHCGACCIAPSITSPIPGMPHGKPAGIPCVQLLPDMRCALFGRPGRPTFCASLRPIDEMCRASATESMDYLRDLESLTKPVWKARELSF